MRLPWHAASNPGPPSLNGRGETGDGPAESCLDEYKPWTQALQGEVEWTGAKSGEEEGKEQYNGSLHVFEEKVQRCMTQTSFSR